MRPCCCPVGRHAHIRVGRFRENGGCGYVLRPAFQLDRATCFNPASGPFSHTSRPVQLRLAVISAQQLPKTEQTAERVVVDPYCVVEVVGVRAPASALPC